MQEIKYKNKVVGLLIRGIKSGSLPITDSKEPLQVVSLKHPKGKLLLPHTHRPRKRVTPKMQESLVIRKGKIKVDLYGPDKKHFKTMTFKAGDIFILQNGGYGIHILEDAEIFEFKNGPFLEDKVLL